MFAANDLRLFKLEENDLGSLLFLKEESWMNRHQVPILNRGDQTKWFHSLDSNPIAPKELYLMAINSEGAKIGIYKAADIDYINQTAEVGWDVFATHRNKGLGKKLVKIGAAFCFQVLNLRRLSCEILQPNQISLKCALNAGFVLEGTKRSAIFREGEYLDSYVLGLLQSEFVE